MPILNGGVRLRVGIGADDRDRVRRGGEREGRERGASMNAAATDRADRTIS